MKKLLQALVLALLALTAVSPARAQPERKPDAEGFEPVDGSMMQKGESIQASKLVAGAYGFIFAAVIVYAATVAARARRVENELDEIKRKLDAKGR
jgi:hypothetical protein